MSKNFSDNPQVLSSILNSMLDCFIAVDKNISILELNPAAEKILRCSRDAVLGKSLVELIIPPQDHAYYGEQIQHHMETGDDRYLNTRMEITALRADGELFPAELTIIPIETDEKEMFALFLRDVSERRQEQNALAGERKLLRTLIDTMPDYIYIKDLEHRFVLTNIAHAQARGFESPDDLIGKTDFDFFPPEMAAEFHAEEKQIFRTGNPLLNYAQPSKGFAGGFDWALSNKIPLHNLDDELVGLVGITRDITEYKKQERELHRHAMLQDNFTDAVISTDLDYRIRTWNKAAEAIYGWLEEDVIGKDSTAVLGTRFETEESHQRMLEELYEKGHWLGEVIQQRKDGTELYILGSVNLLKDADGEPFGVVAINHDISERKQHEQKLQRANARFQRLIENLQGGILLENENHQIEVLNDTFREMFQISTPLETLIGADYSQVLQANKDLFVDPEQFIQRIGTIMHDFKLVLDDTLHLKSGLIYERDFIPITVDDTYVGTLWHYRDVTAKVHARQRWERLLKLEELNKEIIRLFVQMDDIDSALNRTLEMTGHLMDVSRVYVFHCREGERLLDNTHEWCAPGIPAKIDSFQELPFDDLMPSVLPMLVQNGIIASQHIDELPDDVRAILEPKNAKSVLILPLNSGNRIQGFIGCDDVYRSRLWLPEEITTFRIIAEAYARVLEDQKAQKLLIDARDEALRIAKSRTQFVANMSHEIRTPMTGVLGMLELLRESDLDEDQREFANEAFDSARHLLTIINEILDFSKLDAQQVVLESAVVDLRAIANEVRTTLMPQIAHKPLRIEVDIDASVPYHVIGDETRLRQVLMNLAGNAVKFTHEGDITIHIGVLDVAENQARLQFEVNDTGIGITSEGLERIFDSFTQADGTITRKYGGTGLGLAITKQLVELMDGSISVSTTLNEGSTFSFSLTLPVVNSTWSEKQLAEYFKTLKTLILDPNKTARYVLANQLRNLGVQVVEMDGLDELLTAQDKPLFDTIFLPFLMVSAHPGYKRSLRKTISKEQVQLIAYYGDEETPTGVRLQDDEVYLKRPIALSNLYSLLLNANHTSDTPVTAPAAQSNTVTGRVLLAEDYTLGAHLVEHALVDTGIQLDVVDNGLKVLQQLENHDYDLILMDMQMPVMDGREATRRIREADTPYHNIPILALTARVMAEEQSDYEELGIDGIISKPFSPIELRDTVQRWLAQAANDEVSAPEDDY